MTKQQLLTVPHSSIKGYIVELESFLAGETAFDVISDIPQSFGEDNASSTLELLKEVDLELGE